MGTLTLTVQAKKYPSAVVKDDPSNMREVGFAVTTTLSSDIPSPSTLQEMYKLEQWVTDTYWLQTRNTSTSTDWTDDSEQITKWERDQFGKDNDLGEWNSTRYETVFHDQPGFLGMSGHNARALTQLQRLGDYQISFKWKVYNGSTCLKETEVITLKAEPDDSNNITYTNNITKTWTISV